MSSHKVTIPLKDGSLKGSDYFPNVNNAQDVTLTDGGELHEVKIEKFGHSLANSSGQESGGGDNFHLDLTGFDDDFTLSVMSLDPGDTIHVKGAISWSNSGSIYTIKSLGSDDEEHDMTIDVGSTNESDEADIVITCFCKGMLIETIRGQVTVQDLAVGDEVRCGDGVYRPLRWISARHVSGAELMRHPEFRPIRIRRSALGENLPNADLLVSPQHRLLLDDWRAEIMFGEPEVLVAAVHLINDVDITRDFGLDEVSYYHFMFDDHQTIFANGLRTESFFPGEGALEGLEAAVRDELFNFFPELELFPRSYGGPCAFPLRAHEALAMLGA